jgi:myo-inositol-1(or 4)-monophosphatase
MANSPLINAMLAAAYKAGEALIADQSNLVSLTIRTKQGVADMFSEADLRAEATVKDALKAHEPDYGFLGEEGGLEAGGDPDHVWIVDPLDGTTNFLTGSPLFAVNIALTRKGHVIAGVTHVPKLGETFWAEEGRGAFLNGAPIRISNRATLGESVLGVGIPFATKPGHAQFREEMARLTEHVTGVRRLGAGAIDMAWVACGRHDAYWEQSVSAWDMAAGAVIVREAGGVVTGTDGGPLDLMAGTVLASTPVLHGQLVEALRPAG